MTTTTTIPGYCTLCRSRCGTLNRVTDDRLVAVTALDGHPTGRATCAKGRAAPELVDNPQRILHPLKRTRPKDGGDPGWVRIGWDDALDDIASRLADLRAAHGAESVAFSVTTPSGTPMSDSIDWVERFIRLYGSPNTIYGTEICNWHKDVAHAFTFGCGMPSADYANAKLNILWGHNPSSVWLSQAGKLGDAERQGARLLVIDPRATPHARQADLWLAPRPGTDGALALALANLLLERGHIDETFVRRWTNAALLVNDADGHFVTDPDDPQRYLAWHIAEHGVVSLDTRVPTPAALANDLSLYGRVRARLADSRHVDCRPALHHYIDACAAWSPERAAQMTGLTASSIVQAAELIAEAGPAISYHGWTGIGQHTNATQTERAIATLYALTGSFDHPGGNRRWAIPPVNRVNDLSLLEASQRRKALGLDQRPLGPAASGWVTADDVYTAIERGAPYRVRALFGFGGNFLVSQPNPERGERALSQLDFHVHCDLFHTPTNAFADILLPVNTPWEREGLRVGFEIDADAARHVQLRPAMVSPRGESRADYRIAFDLACRLGMGEDFFDGDVERGWNHVLAPIGLDVATLRRSPQGLKVPLEQTPMGYAETDDEGRCQGFATPTRRVEFYSQWLHQHGYPAVPEYVAPRRPGSREWPLTLITAKNGIYCHSQHRQLVSLRRRSPEPTLSLSPRLAKRKGLGAGDWGELVGEHGRVRMRIMLDEDLRDDVVTTDYGWWQGCDDLGHSATPIHGHGSRNVNATISSKRRDPLSGALPLRSAPCDVHKVEGIEGLTWHDYRPMRITDKILEAEDIVSLWLEPVDGDPLPGYLPGQHITLRFPIGGQEITRRYSLSGASEGKRQTRYRITVKRVVARPPLPAGQVSHHIHRELGVGDDVDIRMPDGQFTLPLRHHQPIVLIAGGIGITPFMAQLESLVHHGADAMPEITLIYANRSGRHHAFRQRLTELAMQLPRLRVIDVYSTPRSEDIAGDGFNHAGRIDASVLSPDWTPRRARYYLCGPVEMMDDLTRLLKRHGAAAHEIFRETFTPPPMPTTTDLEPRTVKLARRQHAFIWRPEHGTLLQSAERQGIALPSGCRVGQCESCVLPLVDGQIKTLVDTHHLEADRCLTCQAIPLSDITLDT